MRMDLPGQIYSKDARGSAREIPVWKKAGNGDL